MQPDLLSWRAAETTSGPRTASSDGERVKATPAERWSAFVAAHYNVATAMLDIARERHAAGERVSAKAIAEWARGYFKISINNSAVSGFADWLVEQVPGIKIERRTRKVTP